GIDSTGVHAGTAIGSWGSGPAGIDNELVPLPTALAVNYTSVVEQLPVPVCLPRQPAGLRAASRVRAGRASGGVAAGRAVSGGARPRPSAGRAYRLAQGAGREPRRGLHRAGPASSQLCRAAAAAGCKRPAPPMKCPSCG
nr:hypothetical protein [Tanacetum cinerariifolium]